MTARPPARGVADGLAAPAAVVVGALTVAPAVPVLLWSVGRGWFWPDLLPAPSLAAWTYAASGVSGIPAAFATSLGIALAVSVLSVLAALPAAVVLGRHDFRGKAVVEALLLAPAVVPAIAVGMGLHAVLIRLGLAGTPAGVVLVHLVPALPYAVFPLAAAVAALDPGFGEQARTLGATRRSVLVHVTLPMLAPAVAVAASLAFLVSWSQYALTLLVGSGRVPAMPLVLTQFADAGRLDVAGVAAVLTVLPGLAVLAVAGRAFRPGWSRR